MKPFRLEIRSLGPPVKQERLHEARLPPPTDKKRLAVVGGGPSLIEHMAELEAWDGEIWAINYTHQWLKERGIESTLFTVDPEHFECNADRAIFSSTVPQSVVDQCRDVYIFHMSEQDKNGIAGGCSSAGRTPMLALILGFKEVYFFGCEGSFEDQDHVDRHEVNLKQIIIRAGGHDYKTYPHLALQSDQLAQLIWEWPNIFFDRSGGLLSGMVVNIDSWEVVAVSAEMKADLIRQNGDCGMYEKAYECSI